MSFVKDLINCIFWILGIITAIMAVRTYRNNAKLKRVEWLYSLYKKFYEDPQFKEMRQIIDYNHEQKHEEIKSIIEKSEKKEPLESKEIILLEQLVDYLNFFEFIGVLWIREQLTIDEIQSVFKYYIKQLGDDDFLVKFCQNNDFENLVELIKKVKPS